MRVPCSVEAKENTKIIKQETDKELSKRPVKQVAKQVVQTRYGTFGCIGYHGRGETSCKRK
jgi:hypothetical protein